MSSHSEFDIVIVGAGSAGCALAGKLAARTRLHIAIVEAGSDYGPADGGRWPPQLFDPRRFPKTHDWGFAQSRARVVGGCSAHNQCAIVRALPGDYDRWEALGNTGWSDRHMIPFQNEVERVLPVRQYRDDELASWQRVFLDTACAAGFPRVGRVDDPGAVTGVAPFHANLRDSTRWNAAFAFLDPVRTHSNCVVIADTLADRLIFDGDRATRLVCQGGKEMIELHAEQFVLCGGVYGSPAILMRSGVGSVKALESLGIPTHLPLSGVGENLHDHPGVIIEYEPTDIARHGFEADLAAGRLYQSQVILRTQAPMTEAGHVLHILPYQAPAESGAWRFIVMAFVLAPKSRGRMRLTARDPSDPPAIEFAFLSDPQEQDAEVLADGLRVIQELARHPPLSRSVERANWPAACLHDRTSIKDFVRAHTTGYAHSVGTCRMGPSPAEGAVVDCRGRVHGLSNVFVADASLIPEIPRANTNLTCMLVGLRIAELLLAPGGAKSH